VNTPVSRTADIGASAVGTSCRNISREGWSELSRIAGNSPDRGGSITPTIIQRLGDNA
jgi:hypothetical protein